MGQRHQLFIISSINGRYRTLAAVHHQWLYGAGPTKACWRILQILQHPANKKLIKYELRYASTRPDEWWDELECNRNGDDDPVQFPFITTCLVVGAGLDPRPEFSYHHGVEILSITTDFQKVDNNDGLTMIDISNVDSIRYCFLQLGQAGMTPLTGTQYFLEYYTELSSSGPQPADLSPWRLIVSDTLRSLWPDGEWKEAEVFDATQRSEGDNVPVKSLKSCAFEQLIERALDDPEYETRLADVEQVPDFHSRLREYLGQDSDLVKRSRGLQVLGRAAQQTNLLDLSSYPWLTETQILELIGKKALAEEVTSIDLSTNSMVDVGSIQKILSACPKVTKLTVFSTDNLPLLPLLDSLDGSKVREVLHPDLFRYPLSSSKKVLAISEHLSFLTRAGDIVRQAISIRASPHFDYTPYRRTDGGIQWSDLLIDKNTGGAIDSWVKQRNVNASAIPLLDAMLEPIDVCDWFHQLLCFVGGPLSDLVMSRNAEEDYTMRCAEYLSVSVTVCNDCHLQSTFAHIHELGSMESEASANETLPTPEFSGG